MKLTDLTHPSTEQLTPKQKTLLTSDCVQKLIKKLDCQVLPSKEFQLGTAISKRVDSWLSDIQNNPPPPRIITRLRKPWDDPDLSGIKPGECPF